MLLQQIVGKLDGELVRLKSLRSVVAGLAKPPAGGGTKYRIERYLQAEPPAAGVAVAETEILSAALPAAGLKAKAGTRRGRPRRTAVAAEFREAPVRVPRRTRPVETTALGKASSAGPVVISAAALLREREARQAVKTASHHQHSREAEPEVRPEAYARELAARWRSSPTKA